MIRKVFVLLLPKVHVFDFSCPVQVFYESNQFGEKKFDIKYVASTKEILTEQQVIFSSLTNIEDCKVKPQDVICIPGVDFNAFSSGEIDKEIQRCKDFVKSHHEQGGAIISICTGALVLAKMGLLDYKKCSTHWKCFDYLRSHFPKVKLQENSLFTIDQEIHTSAGMTTGIDMTLAYLERKYDPLLAARVAREMVINVRREDIGDQKNTFLNFKNRFHPVVYEVQQILESRMHEIVSVKQLAEELNMSERNLNRLFKKHMKVSITTYRNKVKLDAAKRLLLYSEKSVKEISGYLGYATEPYFIRLWKKNFGVSPGRFRKGNLISESNIVQ